MSYLLIDHLVESTEKFERKLFFRLKLGKQLSLKEIEFQKGVLPKNSLDETEGKQSIIMLISGSWRTEFSDLFLLKTGTDFLKTHHLSKIFKFFVFLFFLCYKSFNRVHPEFQKN